MKVATFAFVLAVIVVASRPVFVSAQERDPAWYGTWTLRVEKGKAESERWAKQSTLLFTPEGWVETALGRNGQLAGTAVGLGSDGACVMIAAGPSQSCRYQFLDPRHIVMTLKGPGSMASTVNVRLLGGATVEVVIDGTDFYGRSLKGKEIWERGGTPGRRNDETAAG
jgi:hypothetical protein